MKKRTLYFLKDSLTGKFYVSRGLDLGAFKNAVIHTTSSSVKAGIKKRATSYRHDIKDEIKDGAYGYSWAMEAKRNALKRQGLKDFGIVVVKVEVNVG